MSKATAFPSPNQLFSLILNAKFPPLVPIPAPALISPVAFSSTAMSIILKSFLLPLEMLYSTFLKIFRLLISEIDLSKFTFVKGSPSSTFSSPLITSSLVILFPVIFILSTNIFFPSKILNFIFIESPSMISSTLC